MATGERRVSTGLTIALGVGAVSLPVAVWLDPWLLSAVRGVDWSPVEPAVQAITRLGYGGLDVALLVLVAAIARRRGDLEAARRGMVGAVAVGSAGLVGQLIKNLACRARPSAPGAGAFLVDFPCLPAGYPLASFPSGHATTAFAAAAFLALWRPRWSGLFLGLALLVAATRVILDSHFPSDILAGALLGIAAGLLGWAWVRRKEAESGRGTPAG
ncbi:MAG: phosphatase PAP2 family protein [Candidatus Methylomirabilota bacterium]